MINGDSAAMGEVEGSINRRNLAVVTGSLPAVVPAILGPKPLIVSFLAILVASVRGFGFSLGGGGQMRLASFRGLCEKRPSVKKSFHMVLPTTGVTTPYHVIQATGHAKIEVK